ncbi:pentatricopeptide repeat-containing protein At4g01990, mitochondrial-like [Primulina huaijiensis]|uniref:pentatricopeptide repeat-containing protein At4g01990, mitochondrial-like n=1 Tax=Primulina huaijiensis TaxID=1492673 RepID=UPI003CC7469F
MATRRISGLILQKSLLSARWLCTVKETTKTVKEKKNLLFNRVSRLTPFSKTSANDVLDKWVEEGNPVKRFDLVNLIGYCRNRKKFHLALQLSDWMEKMNFERNNADQAVRIDLLYKTKDLASAEKYFDSLQDSEKTEKTLGAILSSFCNEKAIDKASETFKKMKESNYATTLNYNNMLALYHNMDQSEKVISLVEEMEEKHIAVDVYTYNLLINSYAAMKNFDAVEEVVEKMKSNNVELSLFTCGNLATIYVNRGLFEKANHFLEMMEKMDNQVNEFGVGASRTRMKLYSEMNNLSGVKRAWESLKATYGGRPSNTSYLSMLVALSKLGDQESLENLFREWEMGCSHYDFRLPNVLLKFYLRRDVIEEATTLYEKLLSKGMERYSSTLILFATLCIKKCQIDLALKYLETGVDKAKQKEKEFLISEETIKLFLDYFEENCDEDRAEKFIDCMRKIDRLESSVSDSLLSKIRASIRSIDI